MEHLKRAIKAITADAEALSAGFAIYTSTQVAIEQNFRERRGRDPNEKEWEQINRDVATVERNAVNYLRKVIGSARDEGHGGYNEELAGSCWCRWDNKKGLEVIQAHMDEADNPSLSNEEDVAFYKEVSEIGRDAFDAELRFFDIREEDKERLERELSGTTTPEEE